MVYLSFFFSYQPTILISFPPTLLCCLLASKSVRSLAILRPKRSDISPVLCQGGAARSCDTCWKLERGIKCSIVDKERDAARCSVPTKMWQRRKGAHSRGLVSQRGPHCSNATVTVSTESKVLVKGHSCCCTVRWSIIRVNTS